MSGVWYDETPPEPTHPAFLSEQELLRECRIDRGRASGPGGQHRNKIETHVSITHTPTGLTGQAGERREAVVNTRVALRRLRLRLACEHREATPSGDCRPTLWRERVRGGKLSASPKSHDYPALLSLALDVLAEQHWKPSEAATRLEVTSSQLLRLIRHHPPAMAMINESRKRLGKAPLK